VRIDRVSLIPGLFYGIDGMCVGGVRVLRIAPHLAYGNLGQPNMMIPQNAVLTVELSVIAEISNLN
jgi:FKBP-type peptidyl-prolyl cis-trans isomerase